METSIGKIVENAIVWIEGHEHTVELLKWSVVGVLIWSTGVFRALSDFSKRPVLKVDEHYTHFFVEHHTTLGAHSNQMLIVVLADLGIVNPTNHRVGVVGFDMLVRRRGWLRRWWKITKAISLPAPVATPMPNNMVKLIPNWFTHFPSGPEDPGLGRTGVDPQDSTSAIAMFAIALDELNARHTEGTLQVKFRAHLATGRVCSFVGVLSNMREMIKLDGWIEGGVDWARKRQVWTKLD